MTLFLLFTHSWQTFFIENSKLLSVSRRKVGQECIHEYEETRHPAFMTTEMGIQRDAR